MNSVCIITDSTAQFPKPGYLGHELVKVVPFDIQMKGQRYAEGKGIRITDFPPSAQNGLNPRLISPSLQDFKQIYYSLGKDYNEIVVILLSSHLNHAVENAQAAADAVRGQQAVEVIDSQTISAGLGLLVQIAASAAKNGANLTEIDRLVRGTVPNIYTLLCIPSLTYLFHAGRIGQAQAIIGEMFNLYPLFTLEEGCLTPIEKVRSSRHLVDYLIEFIDEFTNILHIGFLQSFPSLQHELRAIREHVNLNYIATPLTEHPINTSLAALMGPNSNGIILLDNSED